MDPDMNKYDLEHVLTAHPVMSKEEWEGIYRDAWSIYYTDEHVETILRRGVASGISTKKIVDALIVFSGATRIEDVHPLQFGFVRRKARRQRRHGMPIESPLIFYPRRAVSSSRASLVRALPALSCNRPARDGGSRLGELRRRSADATCRRRSDAAFRAGLCRQDSEDPWRAAARAGRGGRIEPSTSRRSGIPRRRGALRLARCPSR